MVTAKPPVVSKDDYYPDALKKTRGILFGDFKFMPTQQERIQVSSPLDLIRKERTEKRGNAGVGPQHDHNAGPVRCSDDEFAPTNAREGVAWPIPVQAKDDQRPGFRIIDETPW